MSLKCFCKLPIGNLLTPILWMALVWFVAISPSVSSPAHAEPDEQPLVVGLLTNPSPYYAFSQATGEPIGFALDLWKAVAQEAGLHYSFAYFDSFDAIARAVAQRRVDVIPLLVIDDKSSALFDFSETVQQSPVSIFTRKNAGAIGSESDLIGHRVSVIRGHAGEALMRTYRGELSIVHETPDDALGALMTQTSDAVIYQEHIFWQLARKQGIESLLKTVGPPLRSLPMAIAVRKGQPEVLSALRPALKAYMQSSEFYAAREPWGGNPPPIVPARLVAQILAALLAITIAGLGFWRHFSIVRLNRALARSVAEQRIAEERFKDLAESASDWFFEHDKDFRFTYLSSRFRELTHVPTSRLIGKTRWQDAADAGTDITTDKWQDHIKTLQAHQDWRDFTYTFQTADGEERIVSTSGKAIFDQAGAFQGYRGVGRDVTDSIALEAKLQRAQKMELVGQLSGGIAHDFNNLLTVMVGNLEMLKRNLKSDKRSISYVETASEAVDIGTRLVQRLLGFARRQSLDPTDVDLSALVNETLPLIRSSLQPSIGINLALDADLTHVFADRAQLQNALLNLSINARDAMPNGGELRIETTEEVVDAKYIEEHPGAAPGQYLVLRVTDTGTGIEKDKLDKVIEPFFTTKEVGEGTGLGLSSVYGFVGQSGGFLIIESEVGHGTSVSLYLPPSEQPAPARAIDQPSLAGSTHEGKTVLVVEDEPRVREVTVARLEHLGYRVIDVESADRAMSLLEARPEIDLLLTDIVMPGSMSGIDLADSVRHKWPDIRILFSAGSSKQADELHEQGKLGPWLRKPYKQGELAQKMHEVLNG